MAPTDDDGPSDLRIRDVPEDYKRKWNHLKADLGGEVTHKEALIHILDVYDENPELITDSSASGVEFR